MKRRTFIKSLLLLPIVPLAAKVLSKQRLTHVGTTIGRVSCTHPSFQEIEKILGYKPGPTGRQYNLLIQSNYADMKIRTIAKQLRHAESYGMGPEAFKKLVGGNQG